MDEAGILLDKDFMETDSQKQSIQETDNIFDNESDSSLKENLEKAISNEDYELASKIRDEIQKRSQS